MTGEYLKARLSRFNEADIFIALWMFFSMALQTFRVIYTGQLLFSFLVWNLFLAFMPYAISTWLVKNPRQQTKIGRWLMYLAWLLFIPNSFYILTDLFHLDMNSKLPLWFDLALLLSFAWSGLSLGIQSIRQMELLFTRTTGNTSGIYFTLPVVLLNALGIYVGRYLRYNSWDVISDPFSLTREIVLLFVHPLRYRVDWGMIVCYGILLSLIYGGIRSLGRRLQ